jgi:hypothetical protein
LQQERELVADQFAVKPVGYPASDNHFYNLIINALNREIRRKACPMEDQGQMCQNILYSAGILFPQGVADQVRLGRLAR